MKDHERTERIESARDSVSDSWGRVAAYDAYADGLHTYALGGLRNHRAAASAVYCAFLAAEHHVAHLGDAEMLRPWLYAITRFYCRQGRLPRLYLSGPEAGGAAEPAPFPAAAAGARAAGARGRSGASDAPDASDPSAGTAAARDAVLTGLERSLVQAELASLDWPDTDGMSSAHREVLELSVRHGLESRAVGLILSRPADESFELLSTAWHELERSLAALALLRTTREHCAELAALSADWSGRLTSALRAPLVTHVDACSHCQYYLHKVIGTPQAPTILPHVAAPKALREKVLGDLVDDDPLKATEKAAIATRLMRFDRHGFPMAGLPRVGETVRGGGRVGEEAAARSRPPAAAATSPAGPAAPRRARGLAGLLSGFTASPAATATADAVADAGTRLNRPVPTSELPDAGSRTSQEAATRGRRRAAEVDGVFGGSATRRQGAVGADLEEAFGGGPAQPSWALAAEMNSGSAAKGTHESGRRATAEPGSGGAGAAGRSSHGRPAARAASGPAVETAGSGSGSGRSAARPASAQPNLTLAAELDSAFGTGDRRSTAKPASDRPSPAPAAGLSNAGRSFTEPAAPQPSPALAADLDSAFGARAADRRSAARPAPSPAATAPPSSALGTHESDRRAATQPAPATSPADRRYTGAPLRPAAAAPRPGDASPASHRRSPLPSAVLAAEYDKVAMAPAPGRRSSQSPASRRPAGAAGESPERTTSRRRSVLRSALTSSAVMSGVGAAGVTAFVLFLPSGGDDGGKALLLHDPGNGPAAVNPDLPVPSGSTSLGTLPVAGTPGAGTSASGRSGAQIVAAAVSQPDPAGGAGAAPVGYSHAPAAGQGVLHVGLNQRSNNPSQVTVTLWNSGTAAVVWTATPDAPFLSLSQTGGTLAPGAQQAVTISVDQATAPVSAWTAHVRFDPGGAVVTLSGTGGGSTPPPTGPPTSSATPGGPTTPVSTTPPATPPPTTPPTSQPGGPTGPSSTPSSTPSSAPSTPSQPPSSPTATAATPTGPTVPPPTTGATSAPASPPGTTTSGEPAHAKPGSRH